MLLAVEICECLSINRHRRHGIYFKIVLVSFQLLGNNFGTRRVRNEWYTERKEITRHDSTTTWLLGNVASRGINAVPHDSLACLDFPATLETRGTRGSHVLSRYICIGPINKDFR